MTEQLPIQYPAGAVAVGAEHRRRFWFHVKTPGTIVLLLVAFAELLILGGAWATADFGDDFPAKIFLRPLMLLSLVFPAAAAALVIIAAIERRVIPLALLLLAIGGYFVFEFAPTPAFIAFVYPSVFASILAMARPRRLFMTLMTLVLIACGTTFFLDMFQQKLDYGNKKVITLASMWVVGENKQPIFTDVIRRFEEAHPEYRVAVHYTGRWVLSANRPRLLTGKDIPDIIEGGKEELRILIQEGYAVPLDEYLEQNSIETGRPWKEDWKPQMLDMGRYALKPLRGPDGKPREHPLENKVAMAPSINNLFVFFYNKAILRRLGVEKLPETWDEFLAVCQKAKEAGQQPIMLDKDYREMLADSLLRAALPEGELRKTIEGLPGAKPFTDEMYLRLFRLERQLVDNYVMEGWRASAWPKAQSEFATGRGLFIFCGSWLPGELRTVAVKDKNVFDLGVINLPRFSDEPPGTFAVSNSGWVVLKEGPQREGTIKLLQFLSNHWGREIALKDGNPVTFARDPLPPELDEIAPEMAALRRAASSTPTAYAPKWTQYVWKQKHRAFFEARPSEPAYRTPEQFAMELQEATEQYRAERGEKKWD